MKIPSEAPTCLGRKRLLLNLGCGPDVAPSHWTDIDGSWNLRIQTSWWGRPFSGYFRKSTGYRWPAHVRWMDITRRLPFADGTADAVYASHVLEHLYRSDGLHLLQECRRVLQSKGVLRLVLPDLKAMIHRYLMDDRADAALRLHEDLLMRDQQPPRGMSDYLKYIWADHHSHKFMYDVHLLRQDLEHAGFRDVTECQYLQSRIVEIHEVERSGRVLNGAGFILEAVNP